MPATADESPVASFCFPVVSSSMPAGSANPDRIRPFSPGPRDPQYRGPSAGRPAPHGRDRPAVSGHSLPGSSCSLRASLMRWLAGPAWPSMQLA